MGKIADFGPAAYLLNKDAHELCLTCGVKNSSVDLRCDQALQGEVDKMLEKGSLELVEHLGPGYYSNLLLVQKVTGRWRPIISLSVLSHYVTITSFRMEAVASFLGLIRKRDKMFLVDLSDVYFQIPIHLNSTINQDCLVEQSTRSRHSVSTFPQFSRSSPVFCLVSEWSDR